MIKTPMEMTKEIIADFRRKIFSKEKAINPSTMAKRYLPIDMKFFLLVHPIAAIMQKIIAVPRRALMTTEPIPALVYCATTA